MNSNNYDAGFVYSFDMSEEMPYFKSMPEDIQASAESNTVEVIYESFVTPADEDYLMSRFLAQKGFERGFYWAAAQATEKYLKAFLLMNGQSVKNFKGHPIKKLFEAAGKVDESILALQITPHQNIVVEPSISNLLKKFTAQSFIAELEKYGSPDNRYNAFGVEYNTGHLFAMDSFSFQLRKKIGVISIDRSFNRVSPELIELFERYNPWFSLERNLTLNQIPNIDFPIKSSSSITKLEFLIKNNDSPAYNMALRWLNAKMIFPKIDKNL